MKLSALMADYTPSAEFAGVATNDDFVLAVDIAEESAGKVANYIVVQSGIASVDSQLNPETDEKHISDRVQFLPKHLLSVHSMLLVIVSLGMNSKTLCCLTQSSSAPDRK